MIAAAVIVTATGVLGAGQVPASAQAIGGGASAGPARQSSSAQAGHTLPAPAVEPVSRFLGRDEPGYRVSRAGGQLVAHGRQQHLAAAFGRSGVTVRSGPVAVRMRLAGYGYGTRLRPVRLAAPAAHANEVTYAGRQLAQWYANGPAGLEQGFTITAPPTGATPRGPLTLALTVSGGARASAADGSVTFRAGGSALAYRDLKVTDARGRHLHAWLALAHGRVLLCADAAGARFPLTVDPVFQQVAKLTASDGASNNYLGYSIAVSGTTVAVASPRVTVGSTGYAGAVYVFTEPAGGWADATQVAKLTASDAAAGYELGWSVATDGNTIVAGSINAGPGGHGAVYVFTEPLGGWASENQTAELTASDGATGDELGWSVGIDGNAVVAGAIGATVSGHSQQGAAYVFTEPVGGWADETQAAKLTASDGAANDNLGSSVGISGNNIVAGAPGVNIDANSRQGAAYVFTEPLGGWASENQTAELTAADGAAGNDLGYSVGISGNNVVAGAYSASVGSNAHQGAAYVFTEPSGGWADETQTAKLTASDGAVDDYLGSSVGISGNTVVAGAPSATVGSNGLQGAAYVFTEPSGGWADETQTAKLTASDGAAGDNLGYSVAISGNTSVVGAPSATIGANAAQGAAYVFVSPSPPPPPLLGGLRLAGFLSPRRGSYVRADSTVTVTTRVDYADGSPIPSWLAAELGVGCELTFRASGAQSQRARCMRWNPATLRFTWAWKTRPRPAGTATLTVTLHYPVTSSSLSERLTLAAPRHRRGPPRRARRPRRAHLAIR